MKGLALGTQAVVVLGAVVIATATAQAVSIPVTNAGFELDTAVVEGATGWTIATGGTSTEFWTTAGSGLSAGVDPTGGQGGSANFLTANRLAPEPDAGSNPTTSTASQTLDLSSFAGDIDSGVFSLAELSFYYAAPDNSPDNASATIEFFDAGNSSLGSVSTGALSQTPFESWVGTSLHGDVPTLTRSATISLVGTRAVTGTATNVHFDNVGFSLDSDPPPPSLSIVLTGDSTVAPDSGWGDALDGLLPPEFAVINRGSSGRSTKSFINEGKWQDALDLGGDYVFIQFGHNDQKLDQSDLGTYPIDDPPGGATPGTLDRYRLNLSQMVDDVRDEGGTPVLITPVARRRLVDDGTGGLKFGNEEPFDGPPYGDWGDAFGNNYSLYDYALAVRAVADEKNVGLIDLNQLSLELYQHMLDNGEDLGALGPDITHFNSYGAALIAEIVAEEFQLGLAGLDGDYNENGIVDAADYTVWREAIHAGATSIPNDSTPGLVTEADFTYWRDHFGETLGGGSEAAGATGVPEPAGLSLVLIGGLCAFVVKSRNRRDPL